MIDRVSGRSFLVDTGADISVFLASVENKRIPSSANLIAANGTSIKSFRVRTIKLQFHSVSETHPFRLADVSRPILGSDFFAKTGLLVDVQNQQLVRLPQHQSPLLVVPATRCHSNEVFGLHAPLGNKIRDALKLCRFTLPQTPKASIFFLQSLLSLTNMSAARRAQLRTDGIDSDSD